MASSIVLQVSGLRKSFREKPAVLDLDVKVEGGVLYGLLGPDGSGKTTVLRMLAGVLETDGGTGSILNHSFPAHVESAKPDLGYMPQRFGLYGDLSVWENLLFYARIHRVKGPERKKRMENLLSFSNLLPFRDRLARNLSGGMKQKLGLACALVHNPQLLLLDEPTTGVDPVSRREFWSILSQLVTEGVTMVVATTYLDEAELCHRIGLLHKGRLIREGSPEDLKSSLRETLWELSCAQQAGIREILLSVPGVQEAVRFGEVIHVALDPEKTEPDRVWESLKERGLTVNKVRAVKPSLEDVYILTVRKQDSGAA